METSVLTISLKEYKKELDDLRASLAQLEKGSAEYNKMADEIRGKQQALNEAMSVGKEKTAAAAGSYNAISQEMSALRKEWKATNDEARRNELGVQIAGLNEQLKQLDASTGNFQRSVGNYAIAGESMKSQLKALKEEMAQLLAQGVSPTDERFKELTKTAGVLQDAMGDATSMIKEAANDTSTLATMLDVAKTGTAVFGAWQGAMSAFGIESEETTKAIQKLQGVLTLLNSLQAIQTALVDKGSATYRLWNKAILAVTGAQKAQTVEIQANTTAQGANTVATNAATTATNAFKTALVATGVGAFVVALGALISNWDKLKNAIFGAKDALKSFNDLARLSENFREYQNEQSRASARRIEMLRAEGAEEDRIIKEKQKLNKSMLDEVSARKSQLEMKKANKGLNEEEEKALQNITADYYELLEQMADLNNSLDAYYVKKRKEKEENKEGTRATKEQTNSYEREVYVIKQTNQALEDKISHENKIKKLKGQLTDTDALREELRYYERQKAMWEEIAQVYDRQRKTYKEGSTERLKAEENYQNALRQSILNANQIEIKGWEIANSERDIALKKAEMRYNTYLDDISRDAESAVTRINYEFDSLSRGFKITIPPFDNNVNEYIKKNKTGLLEDNLPDKELKDRLSKMYKDILEESGSYWDELTKGEKDNTSKLLELEQVRGQLLYEARRSAREREIAAVQEYYKTQIDSAKNQEEADKLEAEEKVRINQIKMEADADYAEHNIKMIDLIQEKKKQDLKNHKEWVKSQVDAYTALAKSIGSLMGSIADVMEANLQRKVDNGEIEQELAEQEFERIKKVQLAELWINTLAGATGSFLQAMETYAPPFGAIIGGIAAATAMATGVAQHMNIARQTFDSASAGSGSASSGIQDVAVSPILNEGADVQTMQSLGTEQIINAQGDNRVYILQQDISKSQKQVEVRQSNTTF